MRLLKLDVAHFGPVRKASIELGPGLNVLYGPNDLGKSSLAEAIRAVLLLQSSSSAREAYVPWGTDLSPEVALTFQVEPDARMRVKKTFGLGSKNSAVLERATLTGDFRSEATAREVDGRLRTLLQWGVQPPGGKGAPKGLPETYLSRLLLGRQSEIMAVFEQSLEQDFDESGKKRITLALQAFAQPALFRKVLLETQAKVELAYESRGNPRRGKGSPFVAVREEVKTAEQRLSVIQEQLRGSEGVRVQLEALLTRRDEHAMRVEEARSASARVREAWTRAQAVRAAQERLDLARKELQSVQAAHDGVARKELEVATCRSAVQSAELEVATAHAAVEAAERAVRAAEEQLRTVTAERADALLLQKQTLQTRRVELETARDDANRRLDAARQAGKLVADADARERELVTVEAEVDRLRAALARVEVELRVDTARLEEARARGLVDAVTQAEAQLVSRRQALDRAERAGADASKALEAAEADHQRAVTAERERADALLLQRQTLQTRLAQLETARDQAGRRLQSAKVAGELVADAEARERELAGVEAEVERLGAALGCAEVELRLDSARLDESIAGAQVDAVTRAEEQLVARRTALDVATKALADATRALEGAEEDHQRSRDQLQRVQSESGAQQRALKEEELGRRTLQAEADLRAAEAQAERANDVKARSARTASLEREVEASRAREAETRAAVGAAEASLTEAQAQLDRLGVLASYMDWRALVLQRDQAQAAADRAAQLRAEATNVRGQAERIELELAAIRLPAPAQLVAFRQLERERDVAKARVTVGLTVTILPRQAFELQAASDGDAPESCPAVVGEEITCEAKRELRLVLGDLAEVTVTGGQEQDHQLARDLQARWDAEVEPVLRAAAVTNLDGLENAWRVSAQRQGEAATLRQRAAHLDAQAAAGDAAERLEQASRLVVEREASIAGQDRNALELDATRLGLLAPAGPLFSSPAKASPQAILEGHRKAAENRLSASRKELEARRVDLGQRSVRAETHAKELEQARADQAQAAAALAAPADDVLTASAAAITKARSNLASIETERSGLAKELNTALADAQRQVEQAVARREAARRARDARQKERESAQAEVTTLDGQLELRRQAAQKVDLATLQGRVTALGVELAALSAQAKPPIPLAGRPAPSEAALETLRAKEGSLRDSLSKAKAAVAARAATRDGAVRARDAKLQETGDDWRSILEAARTDLAREETALATLRRELAALDHPRAAGASTDLEQAAARREEARRGRDLRQKERESAQADVTTLEGQLGLRRQAAQAVDLPALVTHVAEIEAELARLPAALGPTAPGLTKRAPTEADLVRMRAAVDSTRTALSASQADAASRRATRDGAVEARDTKLRETGPDWQSLLAAAQAEHVRAQAELATTLRDLAGLEQHRDTAIDAAKAQLASATTAHQHALAQELTRAQVRDRSRTTLDTASGQLEVLRQQAVALDRVAAEKKVTAAQSELAALPVPDPAVPHDPIALRAAEAAVTDAERLLGQVNQDLTRNQAQLELLGGTVIQERAKDAKDAVDRLVARERDVELEYAAWKLLKETLEEAEAQQTTHLGQALVGPVTQRFRALTADRYGPLSLGPNLETHGITAQGELRNIDSLSAGTRDQLSTLLRLTVAAQLQSVLVLDDQLAQSDPKRLKWFTDVLREAGKTTQIVIFTCRPDDYLLGEEYPSQASSVRDLPGLTRVIDLQRVVIRATGVPA